MLIYQQTLTNDYTKVGKEITMAKENYWDKANKFKQMIQLIPERVANSNTNVDFTAGRPQEIMIDLEQLIEDLENEFYLYSEEVEKLLSSK